MKSLPQFDLDQFVYRLVRDAIDESSARYWQLRAELFENARPRIGDFHGRATREDLARRFDALGEVADACRNRSQLCELTEAEEDLIAECIASVEGSDPTGLEVAA